MSERYVKARPKNRQGLTMVETVLVVVILAVLVAVGTAYLKRRGAERVEEPPDEAPALRAPPPPTTSPERNVPPHAEAQEASSVTGTVATGSRRGGQERQPLPGPAQSEGVAQLRRLVLTGNVGADALARSIGLLPGADMAEAWDLIESLPWSEDKEEARKALMVQWVSLDPAAALAFIESDITSARQSRVAARTVMETWAETDPEGAFNWYRDSAGDSELARYMTVSILVKNLYVRNPEDALTRLWELPDISEKRRALMRLYLEDNIEEGRAKLLAVYDEAPTTGDRQAVAGALARAWAAENPAQAAQWVEGLSEAEVRASAMQAVANAWAQKAPEEVVAWLKTVAPGEAKDRAMAQVLSSWAHDNPDAVVDWLRDEPWSKVRETAVSSAARALRYRDPPRAMHLAATLRDEEQRVALMDSVARQWMRSDREAAVIYVLGSDLPDRIKRKYAQQAISGGSGGYGR